MTKLNTLLADKKVNLWNALLGALKGRFVIKTLHVIKI